MNVPNIVLVGFMGVGKTSVATELSQRLNWCVVDTDDVIESESGMPITQIFETLGEERFRDLESEAVTKVASKQNHVISTGGGVVLRPANLEVLKHTGTIFCLTATPDEIWRRVKHETHRPLLHAPDPLSRIRELLGIRAPFYAQADYMIDTVGKSPALAAEEILQIHTARN